MPQVAPRGQERVALPPGHAQHLAQHKLLKPQRIGTRRKRSNTVGGRGARAEKEERERGVLQPPAPFPPLENVDYTHTDRGGV